MIQPSLSIRQKIVLITVTISMLVVTLTLIGYTAYLALTFRRSTIASAASIASITAYSAHTPLTFGDETGAHQALSALEAEPRVAGAIVYDTQGEYFASYRRQGVSTSIFRDVPVGEDLAFLGPWFYYSLPISNGNEPLGSLTLVMSLNMLYENILFGVLVALGMLPLGALLAFFATSRLQRVITGPIANLLDVSLSVRDKGDYSLRAQKTSDDELGQLIDRFNLMLERVKTSTEELEKAKLLAEEANAAKGEFLANMSHEIRTPLNGIISLCQLLQYSDLSTQQRADVDAIIGSANSLRGIITDVLDLSKIEAGKLQIEHISFNLRETVDKVVRQMEPQFIYKGIEFHYEYDPAVPHVVQGDPLRLEQILRNMLSNAYKFTAQHGAVILVVRPLSLGPSEITLRYMIIDSGVGIAKDKLEKIFLAFTQADASTTRKFGGTGLGLTICSRLVSMMNGSINVRSIKNIGTTFLIDIPYNIESLQPTARDGSSSKLPRISTAPKSILVVEDNELNRSTLMRILTGWGHSVSLAVNGQEALELSDSHKFDIILMDLQMPQMGGIEATQHIRRSESENNGIPIIAITADALSGTKQACLEAGMSEYLTKPIDYDQLFSLIEQLIKPGDARLLDGQ